MNTLETLFSRKSIRSYTGEKVSEQELKNILNAAYAAPVGMHKYQDVALTVIQNKALLDEIDSNAAKSFNNPSAHPLYGAPTLILVSIRKPEKGGENVLYSDAAIIAHNMSLAAVDQGAGQCLIWGAVAALNQNPELVKKLNLPEGFVPSCGVVVGRSDENYEQRSITKSIATNEIL